MSTRPRNMSSTSEYAPPSTCRSWRRCRCCVRGATKGRSAIGNIWRCIIWPTRTCLGQPLAQGGGHAMDRAHAPALPRLPAAGLQALRAGRVVVDILPSLKRRSLQPAALPGGGGVRALPNTRAIMSIATPAVRMILPMLMNPWIWSEKCRCVHPDALALEPPRIVDALVAQRIAGTESAPTRAPCRTDQRRAPVTRASR